MASISLRSKEFLLPGERKELASKARGVNKSAVVHALAREAPDAAILSLNGNAHNVLGLFGDKHVKHDEKIRLLANGVRSTLADWLKLLLPHLPPAVVLTLPPPPIESEADIRPFLDEGSSRVDEGQMEPADFRLGLWRSQCESIRSVANELGIAVVELPDGVFSESGFLARDCIGNDPTHANAEYGRRVLVPVVRELEALMSARSRRVVEAPLSTSTERTHPYVALPDYCYWKQAVSEVDPAAVDPVTRPRFKISYTDKVATAGSCFAQHISKRLRDSGFNFLVTEQADFDEEQGHARGFYDFSARYGNIYTARQLLQLFDRAFGYFTPIERVWRRSGGGYCDPFRPRIEPAGFDSEEAVIRDSKSHLAAVRRMFRRLDVFVFTLGLTECWVSRLDGAAYPMAPGVAGGEYNPEKHAFVNFGVAEVEADLRSFLAKLKLINPKARVILTVSPVPLTATAEDRHVLVSTTYSKSVLRVAAEGILNGHENVYYFPSYEIITGQHIGNAYYGPDRRSVTERGVDHVMRVFMSRLTDQGAAGKAAEATEADRIIAEMEELAEAACDEEMLVR